MWFFPPPVGCAEDTLGTRFVLTFLEHRETDVKLEIVPATTKPGTVFVVISTPDDANPGSRTSRAISVEAGRLQEFVKK